MPKPKPLTIAVPTKGKVILPKPEPVFAETRPEDVFGRLTGDSPPKSSSEMKAGVMAEARRRHAGDYSR